MKIGRSADHVSICITQAEFDRFSRVAGSPDKRLRCSVRVDPTEDYLGIAFGEGRVFTADRSGERHRVAFEVANVRAGGLSIFGLTEARYETVQPNAVRVEVPTHARDVRRCPSRPAVVSETYRRESTRPVAEAPTARSSVSDIELIAAREVFNRAILQGYKPSFDGRGCILWFDRERIGA